VTNPSPYAIVLCAARTRLPEILPASIFHFPFSQYDFNTRTSQITPPMENVKLVDTIPGIGSTDSSSVAERIQNH
jgi:hypothetical protein